MSRERSERFGPAIAAGPKRSLRSRLTRLAALWRETNSRREQTPSMVATEVATPVCSPRRPRRPRRPSSVDAHDACGPTGVATSVATIDAPHSPPPQVAGTAPSGSVGDRLDRAFRGVRLGVAVALVGEQVAEGERDEPADRGVPRPLDGELFNRAPPTITGAPAASTLANHMPHHTSSISPHPSASHAVLASRGVPPLPAPGQRRDHPTAQQHARHGQAHPQRRQVVEPARVDGEKCSRGAAQNSPQAFTRSGSHASRNAASSEPTT